MEPACRAPGNDDGRNGGAQTSSRSKAKESGSLVDIEHVASVWKLAAETEKFKP